MPKITIGNSIRFALGQSAWWRPSDWPACPSPDRLIDLCAALASRRELARNTVQTQLTRLVEKGWLRYRSEGKAFYYQATVPREAAQSSIVQRLLDAVFGGSAEGLVMTLLDSRKLSREEADRIRARIEQAEKEENQ